MIIGNMLRNVLRIMRRNIRLVMMKKTTEGRYHETYQNKYAKNIIKMVMRIRIRFMVKYVIRTKIRN